MNVKYELIVQRSKQEDNQNLQNGDINAFKCEIGKLYAELKADIKQKALLAVENSAAAKEPSTVLHFREHIEAIRAPDRAPEIDWEAIKKEIRSQYKAKLANAFAKLGITLGFVHKEFVLDTMTKEVAGWHLFDTKAKYRYETESKNTFSWNLKAQLFAASRLTYYTLDNSGYKALEELDAKYHQAFEAMDNEMSTLIDAMVDDIASRSKDDYDSTKSGGYIDRVKKHRMVLTGVTVALYAVELGLALATIDPFLKAQADCNKVKVINSVLSGELVGVQMREAIASLPGTETLRWNIFYPNPNAWVHTLEHLSYDLISHMEILRKELLYKNIGDNMYMALAVIGLAASMTFTWMLMGKISHMKVYIAKEVLDAAEPKTDTQQKWQNVLADNKSVDSSLTISNAPQKSPTQQCLQDPMPAEDFYNSFNETGKGMIDRLTLLGDQLCKELGTMHRGQ